MDLAFFLSSVYSSRRLEYQSPVYQPANHHNEATLVDVKYQRENLIRIRSNRTMNAQYKLRKYPKVSSRKSRTKDAKYKRNARENDIIGELSSSSDGERLEGENARNSRRKNVAASLPNISDSWVMDARSDFVEGAIDPVDDSGSPWSQFIRRVFGICPHDRKDCQKSNLIRRAFFNEIVLFLTSMVSFETCCRCQIHLLLLQRRQCYYQYSFLCIH